MSKFTAFEYPLSEPVPDHLVQVASKEPAEMTKREAIVYCEWIRSLFPKRIDILRTAFEARGGGDPELLDLSAASLVPLWKWVTTQIQMIPMSEDEKKARNQALHPMLRGVIGIPTMTYSEETMTIIYDLGIYFGEVLVRAHPTVYWDVALKGGKRYIDYHKNVLFGLRGDPNPIRLMNIQVLEEHSKNGGLVESHDPERLLKRFHWWSNELRIITDQKKNS